MNIKKDELTEQFLHTYHHYEKHTELYENTSSDGASTLAFELIMYFFTKQTGRDHAIQEHYEKMQYDRILALIWVKSDCQTIKQAYDIMRTIFDVNRIVVEYRMRKNHQARSQELLDRILVEDTIFGLLDKERILFRQPTMITLDGYGMYLDLLRFLPTVTPQKIEKYIRDHGGVA